MAWFSTKIAHYGYSRVSLNTTSPRTSTAMSGEQKASAMSDKSKLPEHAEGLRSPASESTTRRERHHLVPFLAAATTLTTFSCIGILASTVLSNAPPHCGSSVQEAHDLGCVFDIVSNSWTPRECYFEDLALDFLALPDTVWYADEDHNNTVPLSELEKGEMPLVYPSFGHHDRHCLYTWRKLQHAASSKLMIDAESASGKHVKHCTDYLVGRYPDVKPTLSHRSFSSCVNL
ncbi:hypothetical protein CMUS01_11367 [Colletotrichum musicola]|uniref:Uncharacterized protein n=1 Tax=Colletotrichum musicola TaxID=2175873 RepID=A0A8H6JYB0_9PEZI|nr:hypothetical protein CMUS01_11367 [Colletotrichum musicola]